MANCSVYYRYLLYSVRAYKRCLVHIYLQQVVFPCASRGVTEAAVTIRTTTVTVAIAVATYCCYLLLLLLLLLCRCCCDSTRETATITTIT